MNMKYYAKKTYTDVKLKRDVKKYEELHEAYEKDNVELTEERIKYLVEERKLYNAVDEIAEDEVIEIKPVDEVQEENIIDRIDIVENKNEESEADQQEKVQTTDEDNNEEDEAKESEEEIIEEKEIKNKTTGRGKNNK